MWVSTKRHAYKKTFNIIKRNKIDEENFNCIDCFIVGTYSSKAVEFVRLVVQEPTMNLEMATDWSYFCDG